MLLFLIFLSPFFIFPTEKFIPLFFIFPTFLIIKGIAKGIFLEKTLLNWPLGILLIQIFFSSILSPSYENSLSKIIGALFGFIIYFVLVAIMKSEKAIKKTLLAFLLGGGILSLIGISGMLERSPYQEPLIEPLSRFLKNLPRINYDLPGADKGINPNPLAGILLLVQPLSLLLLYSTIKGDKKKFPFNNHFLNLAIFSLFSLLLTITIIFTQSAGSWIALIISSFFIVFFSSWNKKSIFFILLFMTLLIIFGYTRITSNNDNRIKNIIISKIEQRIPLWKAGKELIDNHPIFGVGMNNARLDPSIGFENAHVHNQLLQIGAELGIPALIAYSSILFLLAWMCIEICKRTKIDWIKAALLGLGLGQFAFLLFGMGDAIPLGAKPGAFFWISLALITAIYKYYHECPKYFSNMKNGPNQGAGTEPRTFTSLVVK
jgi:O-antigen ligase